MYAHVYKQQVNTYRIVSYTTQLLFQSKKSLLSLKKPVNMHIFLCLQNDIIPLWASYKPRLTKSKRNSICHTFDLYWKKLSIEKGRKLHHDMLTAGLHNYIPKKHNRKAFCNAQFSLPRSTSNSFRNRKSISEKWSFP